jgi:hypothetical protein
VVVVVAPRARDAWALIDDRRVFYSPRACTRAYLLQRATQRVTYHTPQKSDAMQYLLVITDLELDSLLNATICDELIYP